MVHAFIIIQNFVKEWFVFWIIQKREKYSMLFDLELRISQFNTVNSLYKSSGD